MSLIFKPKPPISGTTFLFKNVPLRHILSTRSRWLKSTIYYHGDSWISYQRQRPVTASGSYKGAFRARSTVIGFRCVLILICKKKDKNAKNSSRHILVR